MNRLPPAPERDVTYGTPDHEAILHTADTHHADALKVERGLTLGTTDEGLKSIRKCHRLRLLLRRNMLSPSMSPDMVLAPITPYLSASTAWSLSFLSGL